MMKKLLITSAISSAILMGTLPVSIPGISQTQEIEAAQLSKGIGGRTYINSNGSILVTKFNSFHNECVKWYSLYLFWIHRFKGSGYWSSIQFNL